MDETNLRFPAMQLPHAFSHGRGDLDHPRLPCASGFCSTLGDALVVKAGEAIYSELHGFCRFKAVP